MIISFFNFLNKEIFKLTTTKNSPGFWAPKDKLKDFKKIYIDLRNLNHAHLGDQLFFITAFINRDEVDDVIFLINESLLDFYKCFNVNILLDIEKFEAEKDRNSILLTSVKSYLSPLDKINNFFSTIICYDLTDTKIKEPLFNHIYKTFYKDNNSLKKIDIPIGNNNFDVNIFSKFQITENNYFIFNDILYSRKFLRSYLQRSLIRKIKSLKNTNTSIIYVGSKLDSSLDSKLSPFLDIDLRGKLSFYELMLLIKSKRCLGYIGFDNAVMHLCLIFKKTVFIKFRGRLLRSAYMLHKRSINCAVNPEAANNINYL